MIKPRCVPRLSYTPMLCITITHIQHQATRPPSPTPPSFYINAHNDGKDAVYPVASSPAAHRAFIPQPPHTMSSCSISDAVVARNSPPCTSSVFRSNENGRRLRGNSTTGDTSAVSMSEGYGSHAGRHGFTMRAGLVLGASSGRGGFDRVCARDSVMITRCEDATLGSRGTEQGGRRALGGCEPLRLDVSRNMEGACATRDGPLPVAGVVLGECMDTD